MKSFSMKTGSRTQFVNITAKVAQAAADLGVTDGVLTVFVPHTTAGITINENADPDVVTDMGLVFDDIVPWEGSYLHREGNAAAHVKATMVGSSVNVMVENGELRLGTWQGIYFCEFDGPRTRQIWVK